MTPWSLFLWGSFIRHNTGLLCRAVCLSLTNLGCLLLPYTNNNVHYYLAIEAPTITGRYRLFVTYRTRFYHIFFYIIRLRQKCSRQSYVTLLYVNYIQLSILIRSIVMFLHNLKKSQHFTPHLTWDNRTENIDGIHYPYAS